MTDTETRVTAKQQTVFHVRHGGEWADICIDHGTGSDMNGGNGWMTVNILSSFGSYGYHGFSFGCEHWWQFLLELDKEYFLKKFMEEKDRKSFDPDATVKFMRRSLLENRRCCGTDKITARRAWDVIVGIEEHCHNESQFAEDMHDDDYWHTEFYEYFCYDWSSSANGLWETVWQPFIGQLRNREDLQNAA